MKRNKNEKKLPGKKKPVDFTGEKHRCKSSKGEIMYRCSRPLPDFMEHALLNEKDMEAYWKNYRPPVNTCNNISPYWLEKEDSPVDEGKRLESQSVVKFLLLCLLTCIALAALVIIGGLTIYYGCFVHQIIPGLVAVDFKTGLVYTVFGFIEIGLILSGIASLFKIALVLISKLEI